MSLRASSPAAVAELAAHAEFIRTYPEYEHTGAVDRLVVDSREEGDRLEQLVTGSAPALASAGPGGGMTHP